MTVSKARGQQPAARTGLGKNFRSPKKAGSSRQRTSRTAWSVLNPALQKQNLQEQMKKMFVDSRDGDRPLSPRTESAEMAPDPVLPSSAEERGLEIGEWEDIDYDIRVDKQGVGPREDPSGPILASRAQKGLHASWEALIPTLAEDILIYTSNTAGRPGPIAEPILNSDCPHDADKCGTKSARVLALYFDHFKYVEVQSCCCRNTAQVLVRNGLFPTAPSQTRMAISVDLLDFYTALFERSCDAVHAMAAAMNSFYTRRGFYLTDQKGERYKEPFRKGLGYASQWFDKLRGIISKRVHDILDHADEVVQKLGENCAIKPEIKAGGETPGTLHLSECDSSLRRLCPACFGSATFGKALQDGGDFQICTDGNFHHRHLASATTGIPFHEARHFIPKKFVDNVGDNIERARTAKPKKAYKPKVPDEKIDECEHSYHAANGDKKKATSGNDRYDDYGYMALLCRHDIPLFFANIDTPGEKQKYAVALILWFFQLIPSNATVTVLYDVGCVLDRSVQKFAILPETIVSRLLFVTTAMHAYGHCWSCQLNFNPRLCHGLGLTDGEGSERLWSRLIRLIPVVRGSSGARRIWLTDRQLSSIAQESRDDLGDWIKRKLASASTQLFRAEEVLSKATFSEAELRKQWKRQKALQLSPKLYGNSQLKKEVNSLLTLQGELGAVDDAIEAAMQAIESTNLSSNALDLLTALQKTRGQLSSQFEQLHLSLNFQSSLPEMKGVSQKFLETLLLAHDLKISIRTRAIGSFYEWDRLDQAVGGKNQTLGTKLHQQTRQAIAKRQPALMSSIRKYNSYCATLKSLYNPACKLPLPQPLPMKLAELRDNSTLLEDVWTTSGDGSAMWLEDSEMRSAIRALLKKDRCLEEKQRLELEMGNLSRMFERELTAVELALRESSSASLVVQLTQYRDHLLQMEFRWGNPMLRPSQFHIAIKNATKMASQLANGLPPMEAKRQYANATDTLSYIEMATDIEDSFQVQHYDDDDRIENDSCSQSDEDENIEDFDTVMEIQSSREAALADDTSLMPRNTSMISLVWEQPVGLLPDQADIKEQLSPAPSGPLTIPRCIGHIYFQPEDIDRFGQAKSMLNDACLNGCASLLKLYFDQEPALAYYSTRCALFSTHDLVRVRHDAKDYDLWRAILQTQYWNKDVWILPIHRSQHLHWVLCIAYPKCRTVLLYDSLVGQPQSWSNDLKDVSNLLTRIIRLANKFGNTLNLSTEGWIAQPVVTTPVQTNDHDCGLWVLAWITSALRGYATCSNSLTEETIHMWRHFLTSLIASVPLQR